MSEITSDAIEQMRHKLQEGHVNEFLKNLKSPDDELAERNALITVVSKSIARLLEIEQDFVVEMLKQPKDEICLNCLLNNANDVTKLMSLVNAFNFYLTDELEIETKHET